MLALYYLSIISLYKKCPLFLLRISGVLMFALGYKHSSEMHIAIAHRDYGLFCVVGLHRMPSICM